MNLDADFRMNPPLRCDDDVQAIIDGLCDGTLDAIATDHAPHTPQQKSDFESAPNGSIGMETSLSVGITYLVNKGVPAERLTADGYGPDRPMDDNKTKAGRAKNRRVEFNITFEEVTYETVYDRVQNNNNQQ